MYPVQFVGAHISSTVQYFSTKKDYYNWFYGAAGQYYKKWIGAQGEFVICKPGMDLADFHSVKKLLDDQYNDEQLSKLAIQWIGFQNAVMLKGKGTPEAWAWRKLCLGRPIHPETIKIWRTSDGSCGLGVLSR